MPLGKPTMTPDQLAQWCADMEAGVWRRRVLPARPKQRPERRYTPPSIKPPPPHDTIDIGALPSDVIARAKLRSDERAAAIIAARRRGI